MMWNAFVAGMWGMVGAFAGCVGIVGGFIAAGHAADRIDEIRRRRRYAKHIESVGKKS